MRTKTQLLLSAAVCLILSGQPQASPIPSTKVQFHVEPQPLSDAVASWSKQSGLQLIWQMRSLDVSSKLAPKVSGLFSPDEALSLLLAGTGLTYSFVDSETVAIRSSTTSAANDEAVAKTRIARADHQGELRLGSEDPQLAVPGGNATKGAGAREVTNEVIVTGSHIRGVENNTVPVTVLDKEYINSTGVTTTTRLLESLPQNFGFNSQSVVALPPASGATDPAPQSSSITLRGLGQGTTLILLNGRRMAPGFRSGAVDISALPLTAIERVEILTDGASALYGSDAVGGVVNFILRDDFNGGETRLSSGWADGVNEYRLSQALGGAWETGNALLSLGYYNRDLLRADDRGFVPSTSLIGSLLPQDKTYSAVFSGKQQVGGTTKLFADAVYTQRDSRNLGGPTTLNRRTEVDNPQLAVTIGADWTLGADWRVETAGSYARNKMDEVIGSSSGAVDQTLLVGALFEMQTAQIKADGSLFTLWGGDVRAAVGAEWRSESYEDLITARANGAISSDVHSDQIVRSAFAEIYVPIVGDRNSVSGLRRLELSLAGRFDDYSNFGSSTDPQFGIMWEPVAGLRLRASHGTSYRAPNLSDFSYSDTLALAAFTLDPGTPTGSSYRLQILGTDVANLAAQESESSSVGLELEPRTVPGLQLGFNYYHIEYTGRIAAPTFANSMLADPAFSPLFTRDPSTEQVNEILAAAQRGRGLLNLIPGGGLSPDLIDVIVDLRKRNLSVTKTSGLDISMRYAIDTSLGNLSFGVAGTHIYERAEKIVSTSPEIETLDTIYNPPDWRVRGSIGWLHGGWATNLFVNYTDSYFDNRTPTLQPVSSYTTVDARVAYDLGSHSQSRILAGMALSISAQNLLDRDPPRTAVFPGSFDMGFDPTNASPLGRLVVVEISKNW